MYFRVKNILKNNRYQTLKYQYLQFVMIKKAWSQFLLIKKKKKKKSASKAPITGVN
jgi:hypothetical protein